ncbi:MAG TPA: dipeptide epimerase, partial [Pelobium sp.]|nr:dipeptide epimerase [Pelobium sp.]
AKLWKGKNPLAIENRMAELHAFTAYNATCKSAFDIALYDIAAKNKKVPLYQFLGGENRKVITDITVGIDEPEIMATKAKDFVKNGATIIKIKLGKSIAKDLERVKKIRKAVGDKVRIRLDANQGWTFEEAILSLIELEKYDIEFCEQPMRTWFDDDLAELVKRSPIKIMADESCFNHHDARRLIKNTACDAINIKLAKSGGINEALKIYQTATMNNIPCMIGGMLESRLAATASLHFALACKKINYFDLDTSLLGHLIDPVIGGLSYDHYEITLPNGIGIGADIAEEYLKDCENFIV